VINSRFETITWDLTTHKALRKSRTGRGETIRGGRGSGSNDCRHHEKYIWKLEEQIAGVQRNVESVRGVSVGVSRRMRERWSAVLGKGKT